MPKPRINNLQTETAPELDRILISSNTVSMPATAKVLPIRGRTAAIPASPAPPDDPPARRRRRKKPEPACLQEEELKRLFAAIDSTRDRAIFRVGYHAGLRASEIGLIEMRDYDAKTERLDITRLKGSNSGHHPMVREEARVFRAWLKERGNAPGAVFLSNRRRGISRKMLDVLMKEYGQKADIPRKLQHFHILKHSCATHLFDRGFSAEMVQDWLGHADIRNTMIYGKVSNKRRGEMGAALKDWK